MNLKIMMNNINSLYKCLIYAEFINLISQKAFLTNYRNKIFFLVNNKHFAHKYLPNTKEYKYTIEII